MSKNIKMVIIFLVLAAMIGIFVGKNMYEKKSELSSGEKVEYVTSFDEKKEGIPTIIMFKSSTCQYCVQMEKKFKKIYEEYPNKFNLVYIKVDDNSEENKENIQLANMYQVRVVPTTIFMDSEGIAKYRIEGLMEDKDILDILKEFGVE